MNYMQDIQCMHAKNDLLGDCNGPFGLYEMPGISNAQPL